jgi:histidine decarboxylase
MPAPSSAHPTLSAADQQRLDELHARLVEEYSRFLGYPVHGEFDYSPLFRFLSLPVNNVGDPFVPSNYHVNTHEFERELVRDFAQLTQAPADEYWGYVTSGGTEGNMYGLFLAREVLPEGIVYFSEDTHYSVAKALRALHLRNIMIASRPDGTMDLADLRETLRIHRDTPPIVFVNAGTTMKGAVDDLLGIRKILKELALPQHYIHVDAALSGMILPFVADPQPWNFAHGADSLSISGHKMIGCPFPCGVALARRKNVERIARSVEYVGTLDTTLAGSRNGIAPLMLWYAFRTLGREGLRARVQTCLATADYALERLRALSWEAWRHPNSVTVVLRRPPEAITSHWQLAVEREWAHVITMPHVKPASIDRLIADLSALPANPPPPPS